MDIESLKYPIGKYEAEIKPNQRTLEKWIETLEEFPEKIQMITENLQGDEPTWSYRPEGWNIKQIVHHCADSHLNSLLRFKLALTEDNPTIRPYDEKLWATLPDANNIEMEYSYDILYGVHAKLVYLLRSLNEKDLTRKYTHPEHKQEFTVEETIGKYAWHCNHHLAHIQKALIFEGRFDFLQT